jgi:hypothetical protein
LKLIDFFLSDFLISHPLLFMPLLIGSVSFWADAARDDISIINNPTYGPGLWVHLAGIDIALTMDVIMPPAPSHGI